MQLKKAKPIEWLTIAVCVAAALSTFSDRTVFASLGFLLLLIGLMAWQRLPLVLPSSPPEIGEGGLRASGSKRWIGFSEIGAVSYEEPSIALIGKDGRKLLRWRQPIGPLPTLRELEAGVEAARTAPDELQLGRGSASVRSWLDGLKSRFQGAGQYRQHAVDRKHLLRSLADTANRADVRAGAAFALLAEGTAESVELVRPFLSGKSPPLLSATCNMLAPGVVDDECLSQATPYLTREERAAIESFAVRSKLPRVRVDIGPAEPRGIEVEQAAEVSRERARA